MPVYYHTGGGFIGIEMAEQLKGLGLEVTIVEALPQLLGPFDPEVASMLQKKIEDNGVRVVLNSPISSFEEPSAGGRGTDVRPSASICVSFSLYCFFLDPVIPRLPEEDGLSLPQPMVSSSA